MPKEGTAPGVAQGAGTACRCMRGTVSPCHVALLKDTRLLVRVRPCGPSSTIFDRRSRSKMARADTFCSQGRGNRLCAWQVRDHPQVFGHKPRPDAHSALVRHCRGSHFSVGQLCQGTATATRQRHDSDTSARTLPSFVCLPACLCWKIPCACESVWCFAQAPCARMPCTFLRVPSLCLRVCFVCTWSTNSIAVSSPTP